MNTHNIRFYGQLWKIILKLSNTHLTVSLGLPVLLCAVKTVEGDFRFCWMISLNVGQTHKENPNLVRIFLYDIYIE